MSRERETAQRRKRLATFEELLDAQRESAPRCPHCDASANDLRDAEMVMDALRIHIRVLEAAWALEVERDLVAKV